MKKSRRGCLVTPEGRATGPFTESAFVRVLSNVAFSPNALTPGDALALLQANLGHPSHRFWEVAIGFLKRSGRLRKGSWGTTKHRMHISSGSRSTKKGNLATLD